MFRRALLGILLFLAVILPARGVTAAPGDGQPKFFQETGHTLAYTFRVFWEQHGGLPIFGYPITEVFIEAGRPVQYFERARFEWHGKSATVKAGHLGRWLTQFYAKEPAFEPVTRSGDPNRDYFVETQHSLGGGFRDFWRANGGLAVFGFPLSEEFSHVSVEDGQTYTVQLFERARFEWHPELPPPHDVRLGHLGRQYLQIERPAPAWAEAPVVDAAQAWEGIRSTRVRIERIGLDTEIVEGGFSLSGWDVARYTAVHYWPLGGFPGTRGNITLAGHIGYKNTIFNHLPETVVDDEIVLSVGQTERRYRVTQILTVLPTESWVMAPTWDETLTLITCVPLGVYSHRLIVRAVPVEP